MMPRTMIKPALLALALAAALPAAYAQSKKELAAKVVSLQQPAVDAMAAGIARDTAGRDYPKNGHLKFLFQNGQCPR